MTTQHEDIVKKISGARAKANARILFEAGDPEHGQADLVAALTENSGAIGGSNDGNLPSLTATAATLTENAGSIGGSNDGNLPDLVATAVALTEAAGAIGGTNDGDIPDLTTPSASLCAQGVRELATMVNKLTTDNIALRAAARENAAMINKLIADNVALRAAVREVADKTNDLLSELKEADLMAEA
jgi:hypothetical protein